MRETKFIEQNEKKWSEFEGLLRQNKKDPDKLNNLFVQITDDLSYARTYYPNRSVRVYLNGLAQQVFHYVYAGKRFPLSRFKNFWTDDVPQAIWEARKPLLVSFLIFSLACLVGVVSSRIDPDFARIILGDEYVDMTIENIKKGDPMAVYKSREAFGMAFGIALNNLWVAFLTAIFGVLASIGTVFLLLSNGVMLGAFQYFFVEKGVFWESFLTIWIHGTLEISAIIIAGGAGLTAGSGLLFPGTYTRMQAFQITIRRGLKIMIGLVPVFLMAAFFEGFLTRFTETPDVVRGLFILTSLAFVLWYFVWLPREKSKLGFKTASARELPPERRYLLDFTQVKTSGESFSDVFAVFRRNMGLSVMSVLSAAAIFLVIAYYFSEKTLAGTFSFTKGVWGVLEGVHAFFVSDAMFFVMPLQVLILSLLSWLAFVSVDRELPQGWQTSNNRLRNLLALAGICLPTAAVVWVWGMPFNFVTWLTNIVLMPFASLWGYILYRETANPFLALTRTFRLVNWGKSFLIGFLLFNLSLLLFLFLDSPVFDIIASFLSWNVPSGEDNVLQFSAVLVAVVAAVFVYFLFWMMALSGAMQYFSYRESEEAYSLNEKIPEIGQVHRIKGLVKE